MKELTTFEKLIEKQGTEEVEKKQEEIEIKWIDDLRPLKGHTLWEINNTSLKVQKAEFIPNDTADFGEFLKSGAIKKDKEIVIKQGHSYISALNPSSALDRFKRGKGSAKLADKKSMNPFESIRL